MSVDPKDFGGQNVLILGRGNSAFETAGTSSVSPAYPYAEPLRVRLCHWATTRPGILRYAGRCVCAMLPAPLEPPCPRLKLSAPARVSLTPYVADPCLSLLTCTWGPRAISNSLLDTYQLKSLDGLLESDLTDLAIVKDHRNSSHHSEALRGGVLQPEFRRHPPPPGQQ